MEPERLDDLRGHRRRLAPFQVRDQVPRLAHLQPVELRPRPLLPAARAGARGAARLLVGADDRVARPGARDHRRRRPRDPDPPSPDRDRSRILGDLRRCARRADGPRPRIQRTLAPRPGQRALLLVGAGHLAGGPGLPVLHDHRPEDDAEEHARPRALRRLDRAPLGAPDRAGQDGVLGEGGAARRARDRLRRASPDRARPAAPSRPAGPRRARRRRTRRLHGRDRRGRDPGTARDHRGAARTHGAAPPGDDPAVAPGPDGAQAEDGTPDCSRTRRRPPDADRGPDRATTRRARSRLDRRRTERADSPDRRGKGRPDRSAGVSGRSNARPSRTGSRPGRSDRGCQAGRLDAACELCGVRGHLGQTGGANTVERDTRAAGGNERPLVRRACPQRPAARGNSAGDDKRRAARRRRKGVCRHSLHRRRAAGWAELHPGRLPLRDGKRRPLDDGRRPLLARLQQRRPARPLRGQLLLRLRHDQVGANAAGCRGAPSSRTSAAADS